MRRRARGVLLAGTLGLLVIGADCGPPRRPEIRQGSKSYLFNITSDPIPPHESSRPSYDVSQPSSKPNTWTVYYFCKLHPDVETERGTIEASVPPAS